MFDDTIIAISTPYEFGGIGIVRLSGKLSLKIAKSLFKAKKGPVKPRTVLLGTLINPEKNEPFEEAFLTYFPSPHSYTKEDVVEISCHGSPVILEEIVRLGIKQGARHAQTGEFTLRAYINGRIDLIQAEAVNDLIRASSLRQAEISYKQMRGSLSTKVKTLRDSLINTLSKIEARLEFPDENLNIPQKTILNSLEKTIETVEQFIKSYDLGKSLFEGVKIAIVGRTNVGKSTLFNTLLEKKRAIVTPYPGTTRDYLSEIIKIKDSIFTLLDTAGRRKPQHPIEKEGIKKSKELAAQADGILLILDSSLPKTSEDAALLNKYRKKRTILVFNKIDLSGEMDVENIISSAPDLASVKISALKKTNIHELKKAICSEFVKTKDTGDEVILHLHQKLLLEDTLNALKSGKESLHKGYPDEIVAEEVRKSIPLVGQLTGEIRSDDIIEKIFSRFCIGK